MDSRPSRWTHKIAGGLLWIAGLALLAIAVNLRDPLLLPVRRWGVAAIILLGLAGCAAALTRRNRTRASLAGWLLVVVWSGIPILTLSVEGSFWWHKRAVLSSTDATARDLGQHFIIGYWRADEIRPLVAQGLIGGIFISRRNAEGRTAASLRQEIASLQAVRRSAGLPPLIVATDQEGGIVSRLSPPLTALPALASLADLPLNERLDAARDYGTRQGRELAALGITLNFSPVVDLLVNRPRNLLDFNSLIGRRAIASDPSEVTQIALAYSEGLAQSGIRGTLKHFPGLGGVSSDTHYFSAQLDTPIAELQARDWLPFRQVLARSDDALMVAHVVLTHIDPEEPASLSRGVVQGVIRRQWGFRGIVITDDLSMGAAYHRGLCHAVVDALNAGVDLLLISWDGDQFYPAMDCALHARRRGLLDLTLLNQSWARLLALSRP